MHRPLHSLIFALVLFSGFGALSFLFPEGGITLGKDLLLSYPSLDDVIGNTKKTKDISEVLKTLSEVDTSFILTDTQEVGVEAPPETKAPKLITGIQMSDPDALTDFFESLKNIKDNKSAVRVLHYGDSQIEGDRMTDYLRLKLQGQFGGSGPGLISLMPLTQHVGYRVTPDGDEWDRYNVFTAKDKRVSHKNYGVMAGFCRFKGYEDFDPREQPSQAGFKLQNKAGGYSKIRLFYGGARSRTWCEYYDGPALIHADSLESGGYFHWHDFEVSKGSPEQSFQFTGTDSPDFYGMSLEGDGGVMVDNLAMRGSSGTFFHLINNAQLREFYKLFNVKLIILQFGGNTLPALRDSAMAVNYAGYMRSQISLVKKMAPGASILFIGPSDMSVKSGTEYITYPLLEKLRDELKKVVLSSGCAFFDLYDCMGGKNSMPAWVEQKLAASDYTHFSPKGARQMATFLYGSLINEYKSFLKQDKGTN